MNSALTAFVALDSTVDRGVVETLLTSTPRLSVLEYGELDGLGPEREHGDVLVVACRHYTPAVAEYLAQAARTRTTRPIVLLAPVNGNGDVADAFGHGADDIVTIPADSSVEAALATAPQVAFAVEKAVARKRRGGVGVERGVGELICVLGLKGGSGKTLTTANLAVALADAGQRVVVVDLDLQFGDLGLALGMSPEKTMYDLIRAGGSLDADKVADFMAVHPSGVRAVLAPTRPDQAGAIASEFLGELYQVLRETSDFVIVDTPPGFTPEVISTVDGSSGVCMVAMLDALSLKNTKLGLETLQLMDYDRAKVRLVLNRADTKVGITSEDVLSITERTPAVLVPSDRNVVRSINQGVPIAIGHKRSEASRAFHALAGMYIDDRARANGVPSGSKRRRLFRKG
jgi:pilus assembly protein CpaE